MGFIENPTKETKAAAQNRGQEDIHPTEWPWRENEFGHRARCRDHLVKDHWVAEFHESDGNPAPSHEGEPLFGERSFPAGGLRGGPVGLSAHKRSLSKLTSRASASWTFVESWRCKSSKTRRLFVASWAE